MLQPFLCAEIVRDTGSLCKQKHNETISFCTWHQRKGKFSSWHDSLELRTVDNLSHRNTRLGKY